MEIPIHKITAAENLFFKPIFLTSLACMVLATYIAGVMLAPMAHGHDTYISFSHVLIRLDAFKLGDWMPTWTPLDGNGFGSPVPFFYHKLFDLLATALTILLADIVAAMRVSILLFSCLLFYGTWVCAEKLGADKATAWIVATACTLSPYAIADWMERGAVAEYAAMALVPLIIAQAIDCAAGRATGWTMAKLLMLLAALALAHIAIFPPVLALLFFQALFLILKQRRGAWPLMFVSVFVLLGFIALIYVPFVYWGDQFSPMQAAVIGRPAEKTVAWATIFSPLSWTMTFPGTWFGWPIWALLFGLALHLKQGQGPSAGISLGLGLIGLLLVFSMTHTAAPFWRLSEKLSFVQFPWRLLSIATPLIFVALSGMLLSLSSKNRALTLLAILALAAAYAANMAVDILQRYGPLEAEQLAALHRFSPQTRPDGPNTDGGGEYFPAYYRAALKPLDLKKTKARSVLPPMRRLVETDHACSVDNPPPHAHFKQLHIHASCRAKGAVRVNQFLTNILAIRALSANGEIRMPLPGKPMIEFALTPGEWTIQVRERTYFELVKLAWENSIRI